MNATRFFQLLPRTFYGWATLVCYPRNAERYCAVLDSVQAMTTPSMMHLLNTAVSCMDEGECYLEVGAWRGGTLIGALLGNDGVHGYAIDDDSMDEHDKDEQPSAAVWRKNIAAFDLTARTTYIDAQTPAVWERERLTNGQPVGVYLFDGDKSTPARAQDGLMGVAPLLAETALIIVDDANQPEIRLATMNFIRAYSQNAVLVCDMPTPGNCWPGFWNGFQIIGWSR